MNKDTKIIKAVCGIVGFIMVMLIIGLVGGYERDTVSLVTFVKLEAIYIILLYVSIKGIDIMEQIEAGRK